MALIFRVILVTLVSWSTHHLVQRLYLYVLELMFDWISVQLEQTRRQRDEEERRRLAQAMAAETGPEPHQGGDSPTEDNNKEEAGEEQGSDSIEAAPIRNRLNNRVEQYCDLISSGLGLILEDDVTTRFVAAAPPAGEWNLLARNLRQRKRHLNWPLRLAWLLGWMVRYLILLPLRTAACWGCFFLISVVTAIVGQLPNRPFKPRVAATALLQCFRITASCLPMVRRFHNTENRPTMGICVCNHTSPLDVLVLMCDGNYSLTGQRHDGILGVLQRALSRVSPHMWFDRRKLCDREALGMALRSHGHNQERPPILLFPEGTCINNTAVMQFKKGSFAVSDVVYPVAIRYDRRFGEAYWDSTRYSMLRYMLMVVSSWCICCDVWYLPPLQRREGESPVEFCNRVKAAIAAQANIEDLPWDGNLKRWNPVRDWQ